MVYVSKHLQTFCIYLCEYVPQSVKNDGSLTKKYSAFPVF